MPAFGTRVFLCQVSKHSSKSLEFYNKVDSEGGFRRVSIINYDMYLFLGGSQPIRVTIVLVGWVSWFHDNL